MAGVLAVLAALVLLRHIGAGERRRAEAEAAENASDWPRAARAWHAYHAAGDARGDASTRLREARDALEAARPTQARNALEAACRLDPADPRPWLLRLEMLRLEDRPFDAQRLGWAAYAAVPEAARHRILMGLTLALLSAVPEPEARSNLDAWLAAEPGNLEAELARLRRIAAYPRPGDPARPGRIERLESLLHDHPEHVGVRERLVDELADAGQPARGQHVLETWPESARDARFDRQLGRWKLEFDHQPETALAPLARALEALPFDAPTRYRYARALQQVGRADEARAQVEAIARLRESIEPAVLEPRLAAAVRPDAGLDAGRDMASLCHAIGLESLARAWEAEVARSQAAASPGTSPFSAPH